MITYKQGHCQTVSLKSRVLQTVQVHCAMASLCVEKRWEHHNSSDEKTLFSNSLQHVTFKVMKQKDHVWLEKIIMVWIHPSIDVDVTG